MEFLDSVTLRDLTNYVVGVIGAFSVIAELRTKASFKPISMIMGWVGRQMTKDLDTKLVDLQKRQAENTEAIIELDKKVENEFKQKQKEDDEKEAKRLRSDIISFSDSCRLGNRHTKANFENVFRSIDDYNDYIDKHNIPNHYIKEEVAYIKAIYRSCQQGNKFL